VRYFLILFLFLSVTATAQEIELTPDAGRYYLEVHDRYMILVQKDSLNETIIQNFTFTVRNKDLIIKSLTESYKQCGKILVVKDGEILARDDTIKQLRKELWKQKVKTVLVTIGSITLIILIVL
jgi:hypothetical protein